MSRSPIIRTGLLVLFLGIGVWGVMVLPVLFSEEGQRSTLPPAPANIFPPAGGAIGQAGGLPAPGAGLPGAPGAFPAGSVSSPGGFDIGGGSPAAGEPGTDFSAAPGSSGPPPGGAPAASPAGYPQGGPPPGMMMGGSGMMGPVMSQSQIQEMNLAHYAKSLLSRYGKEQKPEVKEKIKSDLRSVLHQQFRLQHQRRDAELARVERRLADLRARLKKRGDAQSTIVDRRLEQLVNDVDGLGWSAEEVPDNLFSEGGMGGMMMPGMSGQSGGAPMGASPGSAGATAVPGGIGVGLPGGGGGAVDEFAPGAGAVPGTPAQPGTGLLPPSLDAGEFPAAAPGGAIAPVPSIGTGLEPDTNPVTLPPRNPADPNPPVGAGSAEPLKS